MKRRIVQFVPTFSTGDAVGNHAAAIRELLQREGFESEIYTESLQPPATEGDAVLIKKGLPDLSDNDIAILHLSTGADMNLRFAELHCHRVIWYHNVTPPVFFRPYNPYMAGICRKAESQVEWLSQKAEFAFADSSENRSSLLNYGYTCPIEVVPILIPFEDYKRKPDEEYLRSLQDGKTNVLFTGRTAPNKKTEDIISAFSVYQRYFCPESRLILAGSFNQQDPYCQCLSAYADRLGLKNILFTGHITFERILSCYRAADIFLCMSEHEGFCVPLLEAMFFDIPVLAYKSTAVPETLGGSGFLLERKDPAETAAVIDRIMKDPELKKAIIRNQRERLGDFSYARSSERFLRVLYDYLNTLK